MLDDKILDRARRLIESRFAERRKALSEEVERIMGKLGFEGSARSSGAFKLVRDACEEEIRTKAKIVWDSIQEVHKALGSPITETLRTDLKEEASRHIENSVREASELMERRLRFMKLNPRHLTLESTKREVNKRIGVKVDLYVDSLLCKPAETEQDIPPAKDKKKKAKIACLFKKIIGWIFKKTSHVIGSVIIAIIGGLIVVILVDIFADFGWIERIKAVIYKILQLN